MKLDPADLSFNSNGTPQSKLFDDVYFSNDDGLAESIYVFLQGNRLLEQWQNWQHTRFCIGETGFGTGLNFLLTLQYFEAFLMAYPSSPLKHLHFVSLEKHPIEATSLAKVYHNWPALKKYSQSVLRQYPPALEGIHRSLHNAGEMLNNVTLDLIYGDASAGLSNIHNIHGGLVNAWFLDGFAPSKNKSMWEQSVYQQMARLSSPQASLATFTAAGAVKRGLQAAGFDVSKIKGYGRKREMIVAQRSALSQEDRAQTQAPYFIRTNAYMKAIPKRVVVVGAGISGVLLAMRLTSLGVKVTLICKDKQPAMGASGNRVAGFYPQLNAEAGINSQFFVHAFLYARRFYDDLLEQGHYFEHDWCSVLQLGFNQNTQTRLHKITKKALWPKQLAEVINAEEASNIAKVDIPYPALHIPSGGWIAPVSLISTCLQKADATGLLSTLYDSTMENYKSNEDGVELTLKTTAGRTHKILSDALIIAAGADSAELTNQFLPMRLTRGQVEDIPESKATTKLGAVLCHKGYFTPAVNGKHALGSTYVKNDLNTEHRTAETSANIDMHKQAMKLAPWMSNIEDLATENIQGRAAIRCSTPDHLPLVGAMPNIAAQTLELSELYKALPLHRYPRGTNVDNVYVLTGLGSRGITTAPILVDTLIAEIMQQAFPLNSPLLNALMPNRFLVRSLIRQEEDYTKNAP